MAGLFYPGMMSVVVVADKTIQQQLIARGKSQGFITYDDILALVPSAEQNLDKVEDLMQELEQAGVVILTAPPAPVEEPEVEDEAVDRIEDLEAPTEEELEELDGPLALDLMADAGYQQAIDTDDVVGLYLK